ncbi:DUF4157 domain-containing protein [Accumulibacter sp.]|uniref:eCIS core domain-containing protein n=1 Tax=Accumulibacter sp. TaxID=2053492 RepID=UPI0026182C30|nr:DUF4157 domain-containing protein [Accumulibacter sp.]
MPAAVPPAAEHKKPATPPASVGNKPGAAASKPDASPGRQAAAGGPAQAGKNLGGPAPAGKNQAGAPQAGAKSGAPATGGGAGVAPANGSQQRFDRMAVRAKLAVSEPGDAVEREADAIASRVMRMPEPAAAPATAAAGPASPAARPEQLKRLLQPNEKKPAVGGGSASPAKAAPPQVPTPTPPAAAQGTGAQAAPTQKAGQAPAPAPTSAQVPAGPAAPAQGPAPGREDLTVKRRADAAASPAAGERQPAAGNAPGTQSELLSGLGAGVPLDVDSRAFFEQRLGRDLGDVRIHADDSAAEAARQLHARAFTWGNHIAFAGGEYQPATSSGRALLAHELAHVVQNDSMTVSNVVRRKADNPKFKDGNDISSDAIDPAKDKKARPALETLKLPAIKARHADVYQKRAGKSLRRPKGYDRKTPPFQTEQVKKWKEAIDLAAFYAAIGFEAGGGRQTLTFYGGKQQSIAGTEGEILEQLKVPKWTPDGSWLNSPLQVDHVVEVQLGGEDAFENYELLTGAHNTNVGSQLRSVIYANVKVYLGEVEKNTGDALVKKYLDDNDIEFRKVEAGGEGKNLEKTAQFWSRKEIVGGKHLIWLQDEKRAKKDEGTDKTRFALYSHTGQGFIDAFPLNKKKVTVVDSGRLAGIKIEKIEITADLDQENSGNIGQLVGKWELPKNVEVSAGTGFQSTLNGVKGKKYAGALSMPPPPKVDVKGGSPVTFGEVGFVRGKLSADGTLTASHPLFAGVQIPVRWRGDDFAFEHTFSVDQLKGKLPVPGLTIDDASLTLFFGTRGLGADGSISFTIAGLGAGILTVTVKQQGAQGPELSATGTLTADRKLFDLATVGIGYSTSKGFFGSGTLGITNPEKIKGIKSASLKASYAESLFTATGSVDPDIPGLKSAALSVTYGKDTLQITGKLGIDEKVPGVEAAEITVSVTQGDKGWKVGASGEVTPKLPGLSGAKLQFSYDDGSVLVEGEFAIKKGPLDGKVTAGVTNAEVDDKGVRGAKGSGSNFKVFGSADIKAEFIKDKLDGKLKLRLLPDGSVRVGGGLAVKDFEVFGRYPADGGEFFNKTISTPSIPLPGLGFSVGSIAVGITFSASVTAKAHASIGPGKISGVTLTVTEFDPATVSFDTLEIGGGATFKVFGDAGFGASAQVNLEFSAAVAKLVGSVGVEATVGIPPEKPILSAASTFTYSQAKGLDILNTLTLDISPELKFRLFGGVSAQLNLLVDTVTVWSKDWTLAEANYKLPVAIKATGSLGYNSKTGKIRPEKPADAIVVEKPKLDENVMKGIVLGDSAPPTVSSVDKDGKESETARPTVNPKRADGAGEQPATPVDENVVARLGTGAPLDPATRGYFEQRLKVDLTQVRVHTGPDAVREAERLSAKAFTVGEHIAFAQDEYQPGTPEGQQLIAHELAHVAQQQGGSGPVVLRWPAVTRTDAQTSETPASIRAMTLSGFSLLTETQLDWATSPALQADAAALASFREIDRFTERPNVASGAGGLKVGEVIAKGIPGIYAPLEKYAEGAATRNTAWLRSTGKIDEAESWGRDLTTLEAAWPAANLSLVMRAPSDPAAAKAPFEKLVDPAKPELANFINYLTTCKPVLSASDGSEVDSFKDLRDEGVLPASYHGRINFARTYHHFTRKTLDGLVANEAFPQWKQQSFWFERPLTVVLYPAIDDNGAFHRNAGLEAMVTSSDILSIVIEGHASVGDYQSQLAPVAARYGINGEIQQALVGGHGNSTVLNLAGSANAAVTADALGTSGGSGANTTGLMTELTRLMSGSPAQRRIVLDACLTDSHHVNSALRASPADAAADIQAAIVANPSLRDVVASIAGAGSTVLGANASFAPSRTTFLPAGATDIGLSVPGDPDLVAGKLAYVEFGTEPTGCLRAVLECWATDQAAGTSVCRDAMRRRIAGGRSAHVPAAATSTWRESVIQPLYDLVANHYWANGDAIRRIGELADNVFVLYMVDHTTPARINNALAVLSGNVAHVNQLMSRVTAAPTSTSSMRVAITLEQAWMQYNNARRGQFMTELDRFGNCALAAQYVDMNLVMPHVPDLLLLPPAGAQLKLALLAAVHAPVATPPPSPLPAHIAFLHALLGAGPTFPAAAGVDAPLRSFASEEDILAKIGRPVAGAPDPTRAPNANINLGRADVPDRNDFAVTPLRRNGVVATLRDDLMVRSTPTTATRANIFNHLPTGSSVLVIGEFRDWYVIEQAAATGFVAKRFITLV